MNKILLLGIVLLILLLWFIYRIFHPLEYEYLKERRKNGKVEI